MECRNDCKWYEPEITWDEPRDIGVYETMTEPPACLFGGEPYKDTFPGEPCIGEYEQAVEE